MADAITIAVDARTATGAFTGVGRYTISLVRSLVEVAPDLELRLLAARGAEHHFAGLGASVVVCPTRMVVPRHPLSDLWLHAWLPLALSWRRIPVLFSTANYLPVFSGGARRVVTIHDLVPFRFPEVDPITFVIFLKLMLKLAASRADLIIAVSESTAREVSSILGVEAARVRVVHNGVLPMFRPLSGDELHQVALPGVAGAPYLLSVGARIPRKNFGRLIEAFATLRARGHPHHLVIAGPPGQSQPELDRLVASHRLGEVVHFVGYPDDRTLVALYNRAALFVYPSIYEGFGIPVLEAMACGAPVACSNVSSIPEVAGEAAVLFDPQSPASIADACDRILSDPDLRSRLRGDGFARCAQFTWEAAALRTADALRSVQR